MSQLIHRLRFSCAQQIFNFMEMFKRCYVWIFGVIFILLSNARIIHSHHCPLLTVGLRRSPATAFTHAYAYIDVNFLIAHLSYSSVTLTHCMDLAVTCRDHNANFTAEKRRVNTTRQPNIPQEMTSGTSMHVWMCSLSKQKFKRWVETFYCCLHVCSILYVLKK